MGLSNEPSCEAGSFSHGHNPHRFLRSEVLRLYFPCAGTLGCVVCLAPQFFLPVYLHMNVGPPWSSIRPPAACSLHPSCSSLPLLVVWVNDPSLTPWLPDFLFWHFFCFEMFCCPCFGCARRQSGCTYASILAGSAGCGFNLRLSDDGWCPASSRMSIGHQYVLPGEVSAQDLCPLLN